MFLKIYTAITFFKTLISLYSDVDHKNLRSSNVFNYKVVIAHD